MRREVFVTNRIQIIIAELGRFGRLLDTGCWRGLRRRVYRLVAHFSILNGTRLSHFIFCRFSSTCIV